MRAERSVRSRLLVWLLGPLAVLLGASAVLAYQTALGIATDGSLFWAPGWDGIRDAHDKAPFARAIAA